MQRMVAEFSKMPGFASSTSLCQAVQEHSEVIAKFGRYPHRNAVLGRVNTSEEDAHLGAGAINWGQGSAKADAAAKTE